MSIGATLVAIVAIIVIGMVLKGPGRKDHAQDLPEPGPSPRERELETELTQLRERVKVLERIATDGNESSRLAAEIDRLRDK